MSAAIPDLEATLTGCRLAHRRLRVTLARIDDESARGPSRLPDWTVGHVVTHIARNADSHARIFEGALAGEHLEQYAGGPDQRAADIEAGAGRAAYVLVDDVVSSFGHLEDLWDRMTPEAWDGHGLSNGKVWPCREVAFARWREVEVHHVDLGVGYDPVDWMDDYVAAELVLAVACLPARIADPGERAALLAWLIGRGDQPVELNLDRWRP